MRIAAIFLLITSLGCEIDRDGTSLSTFDVTGSQTADTCGAFTGSPSVSLAAEIYAEDHNRARWYTLEGPSIGGVVVDGVYRFIQVQQLPQLDPQPSIGFQGCTLFRQDVIEVHLPEILDGGVADASQDASGDAGTTTDAGTEKGTFVIEYASAQNSDCTPILQANGGIYAVLPCSVSYDIVANKR